jgi:hypothetical protein
MYTNEHLKEIIEASGVEHAVTVVDYNDIIDPNVRLMFREISFNLTNIWNALDMEKK